MLGLGEGVPLQSLTEVVGHRWSRVAGLTRRPRTGDAFTKPCPLHAHFPLISWLRDSHTLVICQLQHSYLGLRKARCSVPFDRNQILIRFKTLDRAKPLDALSYALCALAVNNLGVFIYPGWRSYCVYYVNRHCRNPV